MKLSDIFVSNYLNADSFSASPTSYAIKSITQEDVVGEGKQKDFKLVLYLEANEKGFICNKTNAQLIEICYGDETDNWLDQPVTLANQKVPFQGKLVDATRVQPDSRAMKAAAAKMKKETQG